MRNPLRREPQPEHAEAVPQGEDASQETSEPIQREIGPAARQRFYVPPADLSGGIAEAFSNISRSVAEYCWKVIDGDDRASDYFKHIVLSFCEQLQGAVYVLNREDGLWLDAKIRQAYNLNGVTFSRFINRVMGAALQKSGMWGKKLPGMSIEDGKGLEDILSYPGKRSEP